MDYHQEDDDVDDNDNDISVLRRLLFIRQAKLMKNFHILVDK